MDYLRDGIHLRGLAQKDPVVEYRTEGHQMFNEMMAEVQQEVVAGLFQFVIEVDGPDGRAVIDPFLIEEDLDSLVAQHEDVRAFDGVAAPPQSVPEGLAQQPREDSAWSRSTEWGGTPTSTPLPPVAEDRSSNTMRGQAPGAAGRQKKKPAKKKRRG
jgi:preprotein translocase subunit SecA